MTDQSILQRIENYLIGVGHAVDDEVHKLLGEIKAEYESANARVDEVEARIQKAQAALRGE